MRDQRQVADGFGPTPGGVSSGMAPELIRQDQVAFAINTTFRESYPQTRPVFRRLALDFESEEERRYFSSHQCQSAIRYDPPNSTPVVATMVGGRLYTVTVSDSDARATVRNVTPTNDQNSSVQPLMWMVQAAQYLVVQDGVSRPIVYNGGTARRAKAGSLAPDNTWEVTPEVPVGKQMAYGNWRLFVALPDGRQIKAGDFAYVTETSVLEFTETQYLEGGGTLSIPTESGDIRSLLFMAQSDSTSGQGALLASTPTCIVAFNPVPQRAQWEQIEFSKIAVLNRGFLSQGGTTTVNGDVWGRSIDGIRSFVMTQRQARTWSHTPMSREMDRVLSKDTESLLDHSSCVVFDNRLLMTCSPYRIASKNSGVAHRGIVALNFDNVSAVGESAPPAYDGLWTGIEPYALVSGLFGGTERCFAVVEGGSGDTEIWEITKEFGNDNGDCRVESVIESRTMLRTPPVNYPKKLTVMDFWYDKLMGTVSFDLKFRPDQYPCWIDWDSWSECAPIGACDSDFSSCLVPSMGLQQYRVHVTTKQAPDDCDPVLHVPYKIAYSFQFRLTWVGPARIKQCLMKAIQVDEPPVVC